MKRQWQSVAQDFERRDEAEQEAIVNLLHEWLRSLRRKV
jgi:hypothetical protein